VDTARQAQVRARLDAIASGSVAPGSLDSEQAAFAGLAGAIGLSALLYHGFAGAGARRNLKKAATRARSESPAADAVADAAAAAGVVLLSNWDERDGCPGRRGGVRRFPRAAGWSAGRAHGWFTGSRVPAGEAGRRGRDGGGVPRA